MAGKFSASPRDNAEFMTSLSLSHLNRGPRRKRTFDELSDHPYPTDRGGIIYVRTPHFRMPKAVVNTPQLDLRTAVMDDIITVVSSILMQR